MRGKNNDTRLYSSPPSAINVYDADSERLYVFIKFLFPGDALTNLSGITNSTFSQTNALEERFHFY